MSTYEAQLNEVDSILFIVVGASLGRAVRSSMYYGPTRERHQLPYGWCFDHGSGQRMKLSSEQLIIGLICQMRASGASCYKIADYLNRASIATRYGNIWRDVQVQRILSRNLETWKESSS